MTTLIRSAILFALLTATVSAQPPAECPSTVTFKEAVAAIGSDIRIQPVFSQDGLKGWRLYWGGENERLDPQGIKVGTLLTHVCGVIARDVQASDNSVNCSAVASCQVEFTFQMKDGAERKVLLERAATTATP